ncbi:GntR family transcriptional regulator [Microbispora triticiradicis]|uniref:GntR family transcriptional regulator n=2 Tax=Microbispora TaxID=2005 RepID=A0ABY3LTH9_9ACTN|nr:MULTISPECIES: GntR family transcriptional regulator [Microbispora]TLP66060.1 GntR family transcriptional regulator [Microbispora fusca]TYB53576.1 GntR family transcriptional regulator [Microbispora tritici]
MSSEEYAPPKYAQIVQAIRRRIADGTYPPGSLLPSETQLINEFHVSRPTVVRALQVLQLRGVIEREHGKGSFVKTTPPAAAEEASRPGRAVLDRAEADENGFPVSVGEHPAPASVAKLLGIAEKSPVMMRRVLFRDADRPVDLVTIWCPVELAEGTDLSRPEPLTAGIRQHLQHTKGLKLEHVAERLSARHPSQEEAELLELRKTAPVLGVLASVYNGGGRPALIVDLVLPGDLHELEDAYSL